MNIILHRSTGNPVGVKDVYEGKTAKIEVTNYLRDFKDCEATIALTFEGTATSCEYAYQRKAVIKLSTSEAQILVNQLSAKIEAERLAQLAFEKAQVADGDML